jgi:transcription elongation GreA/GreB family factor
MIVQGEPLYITETGRLELESELACLQHLWRQAVAEQAALRRAGLDGEGFTPTAELVALDREIRRLEAELCGSRLVADPAQQAGVGSQVHLRDEHGREFSITLVGSLAASGREGLVSYQSALGHALLGRCVGERVSVCQEDRCREVEILEVAEMPNEGAA